MKAQFAALALLPLALVFVSTKESLPATQPRALAEDSWRTNRAWYDGKAEVCVYEATRVIYGVERKYEARAYTNKQQMDPATTTKAGRSGGVEVFKHHWSERVPTAAYDYDFSTASFTRTDDLSPFKLTASTQEDCGSSFKQATRDGDMLSYFESSYFPGDGVRTGKLGSAGELTFEDALPLVLRDSIFDRDKRVEIQLVPTQKDTHAVSWQATPHVVGYVGVENLTLPAGDFRAHVIQLFGPDKKAVATYWFAESGEAPLLHALLKYENHATGVKYALKSHERTAYWERR